MSREAVLAKLTRIFGPERAETILTGTMRTANLKDLSSAQDRLRFARVLIAAGGQFAAVGNALAVQAILEGARDSGTKSGNYDRRELPETLAKAKQKKP